MSGRDYPGGKPAPYVDQLLIGGKGGVHHIWACDHLQDDAQRDGVPARLQEAHGPREVRDERHPLRRSRSHGRGDHGRDPAGRAFQRRCRHRAHKDRPGRPCRAACGDLGRDEPHLDERRAAHAAHRALHGSAGQREARLSDRRRAGPGAGKIVAQGRQERHCRQVQGLSTGRPKKTPSWTATTSMPTAESS